MKIIKPHVYSRFKRLVGLVVQYKIVFWLAVGLFLYRIQGLVQGKSPLEHNVLTTGNGAPWHELITNIFWLPLSLIQTLAHQIFGSPGSLQVRLPSVLFGALAVLMIYTLIKHWHGQRIAVLITLLFACNAWVLHVSRVGTTDSLYLALIPILLVIQMYMVRAGSNKNVARACLVVCGLLLTIPGSVWLVGLSLFWQRNAIKTAWLASSTKIQKFAYAACGLIWIPLIGYSLRSVHQLTVWLGLPEPINGYQIARQIGFTPIHLLVRGPLDNTRWLGHAPILDVASLVLVLVGIWFYVTHLRATRSKILGSFALVSVILVGLGGAVPLSVCVPLLFVFAAMGIAYLLRDWFSVFPVNPVASIAGVLLIGFVIIVACTYNLRAYFVAWPKDTTTLTTFK